MRVLLTTFALIAVVVAAAAASSFVCKASGRLGQPVRFEFSQESSKQPKTDIKAFTVSTRTEDDRWKAMWSIVGSGALTRPIEYGVTPAGYTTMTKPEKLMPGRVYAATATDEQGGSASVTFGFDKDGTMVFVDSLD